MTTSHTSRRSDEPLLSVRDLSVTFGIKHATPFRAVDGLSFDVRPGQTVGLVGESGCGKSVTSLAIMGLLPGRGNEVSGSVTFDGTDLLGLSDKQMRARRGRDVSMIFQDPLSSLNPVVPIGRQVTEVLERHKGMSKKEAMPHAREMLRKVGIPDPDRRLKDYPHQLSGGMRQRVMIAMALACDPKLLIADEPTTALDVTIQAQILDLLTRLQREKGMALVLITHDMGVVAETAQRVQVQYAGQKVEEQGVAGLQIRDLGRRPGFAADRTACGDAGGQGGKARVGGTVLLDQVPLMLRTGFDSFEVHHAPTIERLVEKRLPGIDLHYQPAADKTDAGTGYSWRRTAILNG